MILEVTPVPFNSNHRGGGESFPWRLFNGLIKRENAIMCTSMMLGETTNDFSIYEIDAHFFNLDPFISKNNPIPTLNGLKRIKELLSDTNVEFVHVHNFRMISSSLWLLLSKFMGENRKYKVILTDHGSHFFPFPKFLLKSVDYYGVVSEVSGDVLNSLVRKPTFTIPIIIPDQSFNTETSWTKEIDLLVFGRYAPQKRQDLAICIAEQLIKKGHKGLKMIIAGGVHDKKYFRKLTQMVIEKGLSNNVSIIGSVDEKTHMRLLHSSKVLLLLSWIKDLYGRSYQTPELSPTVVLEAAAAGIPSVVSDIPAVRSVIRENETGIVVNPTDVKEAADKIEELLLDENKIIDMGLAAKKLCRTINYEERVIGDFLTRLDLIRSGKF